MLFIFIIYTLSFGLSLLNRGVYWDDWAVPFGKSFDFITNTGFQIGKISGFYILAILDSLRSLSLYRIITFIAYGLTGYFAYSILASIKEIDKKSRMLLVTFFLIFPANDGRIMMNLIVYSLANFFFYFGWWLVSTYFRKKRLFIRVLSLILFWLSFNVSSILFFYSLVLIYIAYQEKQQGGSWKNIPRIVMKYADYILLPLLYFAIYLVFTPPFGQYAGYNTIQASHLFSALYRTFGSYLTSFLAVFISSLYALFNMSLINILWNAAQQLNFHPYTNALSVKNMIDLIILSISVTMTELVKNNFILIASLAVSEILLIYMLLVKQLQTVSKSKRTDGIFLLLGCAFFYIALFPYYAVNKIPSAVNGFSDRHLLLAPLGASFIIVYGVRLLSNIGKSRPRMALAIYAVCVAMFVSYHIRLNLDYLKDWYKQLGVMEAMKENTQLKEHTTFLFIDNTMDINVHHRPYAFYEFSGLMRLVFGNQTRFGSNINEFVTYNNTINAPYEQQMKFSQHNEYTNTFTTLFNMKEYKQKDPEYVIEINFGHFPITDQNLAYLMYLEMKDTFLYKQTLKNIVQLSSTPIIQNQ